MGVVSRMKTWTYLLFLAAGSALSTASIIEDRQTSTNWTVGQTVNTTSGPVSGHAALIASGVSEYLGIPFAQAPIGNLRFEAPEKFNGTAPLDGSVFGYSCPVRGSKTTTTYTTQQLSQANATLVGLATLSLMSNTGALESEDCLYLNVWTKPQVGEKKKAVLVWLFGGGFNSGSSTIPGYNGANWPELEDVVLVSFNYRLSIFGFPGNPQGTNNLALLDQRMAIEWVRDNIANFGGDPEKITLFGQSAGAASIDLYSYAYTADPIAAGFITESGTVFNWGLPNTESFSSLAWSTVAQNLSCGNLASPDQAAVKACMKTKSVDQIFAAIPATSATAAILGLFGPTVDNTLVFSNYSSRTPAKVPMLLGSNNYEGGSFRTTFGLEGLFLPDVFWADFNLQEFTCPSGVRANASIAAQNPTWRYRYFGVWPNLAISTESGTWHASEIPMLFNIFPSAPPDAPETADQISIATYMRGAWATFAKNPSKGLLTYGTGWPKYNPAHDTLVRLAYNNITGTNLINPRRYDADCVFINVSSTEAGPPFPVLPDLGASITPTGVASATNSPLATTTASAAGLMEISLWVELGFALGAVFAGILL